MKKIIIVMVAMLLAGLSLQPIEAAQVSPGNSDKTEMVAEKEYRCTVTVYARGSRDTWPYEGATVTGEARGGFTKDVKTDSKGRATLVWHSGDELKAIYVKGTRFGETSTKFEGRYEDGGSYTFYIDA